MEDRVYDELLYSFQLKKVLDGSTMDESFAWACIRNCTVYCGLVFTEAHGQALEKRLAKLVTCVVLHLIFVCAHDAIFTVGCLWEILVGSFA